MSVEQATTFAIILGVMAMLVWDRIRYDLVAGAGLVAAIATGVVPADQAFAGFSDDIVVLVAAALVVSAAIERSGIVDRLLAPLVGRLDTTPKQVAVLAGTVAVLSAFIKNIGALAIFLPVALQLARRYRLPPSRLLMPLSFASLLGGTATMIGTSPNIIVSRVRADILGEPFGMFSFTPVGATLTVLGIAFLTVGWRLLPEKRRSGAAQPFTVADYTAEACLPADSPFVGKTVREFESAADGEAQVIAIIREGGRRYSPAGHWTLYGDDVLVLECDATVLKRMVGLAHLRMPGAGKLAERDTEESVVVEAVVTQGSPLIGNSAVDLRLREHFGLHLVALSRRGVPVRVRLRRAKIQKGDLVAFVGRPEEMEDKLAILGCVPLAERRIDLAPPGRTWLPVAILATAMVVAAAELAPVAVAFFGAAVLMLLTGCLKLTDAYERIEWPILVLLACLIPLSEALARTGGTQLIAAALAATAAMVPPVVAVALILLVSMAVTPFLNNAATVLMLAPIAVSTAEALQLKPDAFLMAVAMGAACDFLTPIGHQCNTLVMGPGGYRFGDYWRLGLPLSVMVAVVAPLIITLLWPLT